jgi:serine/threonine-protein kinase
MATCPECRLKFPDDTESCPQHGKALVPDELLAAGEEQPLAEGVMVGEYRIQYKLGAGTFGEVYAGEQPVIGKRVAVKVLNRRFASDPVVVSRFVAEARAVNKIRQRNIIDIFSFGTLPGTGRHYFVMEHLDGMTLGAMLSRTGRLPVALVLPLVKGIADALDAVHEAGITHRDLKPDNVFLARERDGTYFPKLLDFGIAKLVGADVAHKTGSGMVLGTPRYMSPEQARGKPTDHRADIYALGVMIHEMLTGTALFEGDSAVDLLLKQAVDDPPRLSDVCHDLPPELDDPLLDMLAKRPDDRPATAGKAVEALAATARELGLDRSDITLSKLLEESPGTDPGSPKCTGTTITAGPRRGAATPTPSGRSRSASGSRDSVDPNSKTERAPVPAGATLRSGPVAHSATPVVGEHPATNGAPFGASPGPTTESVSALATSSTVRRLTRARRAQIIAGTAIAAALVFALWASGQRTSAMGPPAVSVGASTGAPNTASLGPSSPGAPTPGRSTEPAPATAAPPSTPAEPEPTVRPAMPTPSSGPTAADAGLPARPSSAGPHSGKPVASGRNVEKMLEDR